MEPAVEWAVYAWIYDDSGSNWGHRHFSLGELNNNAGSDEAEGLLGFGVKKGDGGTYVTMNVVDETSSWDYTDDLNLLLWTDVTREQSSDDGDDSTDDDATPSPAVDVRKIEASLSFTGYDRGDFMNNHIGTFKQGVADACGADAGVEAADVYVTSVTDASRRLTRRLLQTSGINVFFEIANITTAALATELLETLEDVDAVSTALTAAGFTNIDELEADVDISENDDSAPVADPPDTTTVVETEPEPGYTEGIIVCGVFLFLYVAVTNWRFAMFVPEGHVAGLFKFFMGKERFMRVRGDGPSECCCLSPTTASLELQQVRVEKAKPKEKKKLFGIFGGKKKEEKNLNVNVNVGGR